MTRFPRTTMKCERVFRYPSFQLPLGRLSGADPVWRAAHPGQIHTTAFEGWAGFAAIVMRQPWSASVPAVRVFGASASQRLHVSEDIFSLSPLASPLPRQHGHATCHARLPSGGLYRSSQIQPRSTFRPCAHAFDCR